MTGTALQDAAHRLSRAARDGRGWVSDLAPKAQSVANEAQALIIAGRRAENLARKVAGAAGRRPCVGVFGPSQAGKSYLVSALARRPGTALVCDFAGTAKDFLREINPPGDRESTGLVTRFTTARPAAPDPAFPVDLRLLSETDLVKVLANAFFSDFDANNLTVPLPNETSLRKTVAGLESAAGAGVVAPHLDDIALFDLGEYFERHFTARIEAFRLSGYWEALIRLGARLPLSQRAQLFAPLWGGLAPLTALFEHLAAGLERLGHAADARAALTALTPRDKSIIDVQTLKQLQTPADAQDLIEVRPLLGAAPGQAGAPGAPVALPRALLTALIAELSVAINDTPWPFLAQTDLLDFPGARSREKMIAMAGDPSEQADQARGLLLRGKIAYLFQRFTDERELTAMLLCMPNNPAEVKDLAAMVTGWIGVTHGETPAERAAVRNALFLVLTKFDLEFQEKGGETSETRRGKWDRRLFASFLELYRRSGWPEDWDGKPFANSLFLRNPGMKQEHLMDYAEIRRLDDGGEQLIERGPSPGKAALIAEYREAFLTSELCGRHFAQREAVWDAALQPNDGGVSYLVERLTQTLDAGLKARQIGERLTEQARGLLHQLRRHHHAADDAGRQEKDKAISALRRELYARVSRPPYPFAPFARLLASWTLDDREMRECFLTVAALKLETLTAAPSAGAAAPAAGQAAAAPAEDPWADDPWAEPAPIPTASPTASLAAAPAAPARILDRSAVFAREVMNLWAEKLRRVAQNAGTFGLSTALMEDLAGELIVGADRLGLGDQIAAALRAQIQAANVRWDDAADRVVTLAGGVLNDYLADLGAGLLAAEQRPKRPRSDLAIFTPAPKPSAAAPVELEPQRRPLEQERFLDWATALHGLALDNVSHGGGRDIDAEENARLGKILGDLSAVADRAA